MSSNPAAPATGPTAGGSTGTTATGATGPASEPLVQLLYAGEVAPDARAAGQRARMLAWLGAMAFTPDQLRSLLTLTWEVRAARDADAAERAAIGAREAAELTPVYDAITTLYATTPSPSEADLAALRARLEAARAAAYAGQDPAAARLARVRALMDRTGAWASALPADQQARLAECRFFLQHRLGPYSDADSPSAWLGTTSGGADFAALATRERPATGEMDLGGLWARPSAGPDGSASPDAAGIRGLRAAALLLVALQEDGLPDALEVRLGLRAPTDYAPATPPGPAPTPTPAPGSPAPPR